MNGLRLFAVAALVSLGALWMPAEVMPNTGTTKKWTVEDVLLEESASDFQISPDGRWAVWVKRQIDKEKGRAVSNLWLSSLTEEREIQLTRGKYSHSDPKWSPDGALISFLSNRPLPASERKRKPASEQLWLINPAGGEPWPATEFAAGADTYLWEGAGPIVAHGWKDKETVVLAIREEATLYERQIQERKDTSQAVEDAAHESPVRLFLLSVKDGKLRRLTENRHWIELLAVSPDGQWAATSHQRSLSFEFDHKITPALYLTNLETGEQRAVAADQRWYPDRLEWARDSSGFYFASEYSTHPKYFTATITRLYFYEIASEQVREVDLDWENGLADQGASLRATPEGFLTLLADGVRYRAAHYTKQGNTWRRSQVEGAHAENIFNWAVGQDGQTLVYEHSTASRPTQWYRAMLNGTGLEGEEQLTHLNPTFAHKPIARTEIVRWTGAQNEEVEGVLYYPNEYEPGKRYPLILMIHGGPTGVDLDAWFMATSRPIPLFTQRNAFLLRANYHGSGNYSLAWAESIGGGKYYELERVDLENGVDAMIERGLADPEKLGVMGWSNGAILTTELITRSDRYKAASAGAGDVEWISDWGNVDFGASFDNYYLGAAPYEDPELYVRKSPYFRLKNVTTPTIIYTGTEDRNVPPLPGDATGDRDSGAIHPVSWRAARAAAVRAPTAQGGGGPGVVRPLPVPDL
jgi:dipeptidyl aminopeptidase/acylaminoacyl peptidase